MFKKSINRKLMILFFAVGLAALSVVGTYSYFNAKDALLKRTLEQLTSIRVIKKEQVEFFFNERFKNVNVLAENYYIKALLDDIYANGSNTQYNEYYSSDKSKSIIERLNFSPLGYSGIYLISNLGEDELEVFTFVNEGIVRINPDSIFRKQFNALWFETISKNEPYIQDFEKHAHNAEPSCFVGKRIYSTMHNHSAVLAIQIPITEINSIMLEENPENGLGKSGEVYLVGSDYLMRSRSRFIPNSVLKTVVNTQSIRNAFSNKYGSALIDDYRTVSCLSSYDRLVLPGLNWAIAAEIDYSEAMVPIKSIRNDILFLSLVICVFLFSISHFISRTITNPIVKLKNAAQQIGKGDLDVTLNPKSDDEIGLLTLAFNTMALQLKEERLKRMSALYDGQEMERQRISRELHDGLGQKMVAIKLQLESTSKQTPEEIKETIKDVKESFLTTIDEVRQISNNLAPNILNESGIDIALQSLCNSFTKSAETDIELSVYGDYSTSNPKVIFYVYRIAQEALTNSLKHSGATRIQLQLIGNTENIILIIEDNGRGFDYQSNFCTPCNGIYNMKERARLLNGTLDIETEPTTGTTIRLKIPKNQGLV
jgi:signal transduction histidine kinase